MSNDESVSGIQEMIDRLSQEGVAEGERQAAQLVSDAERKADNILDAARHEAKEILRRAREEAQQYQAAGEAALSLAARDAMRDFGSRIHGDWRGRLQELVQYELQQPEVIKQMILEITSQATDRIQDKAIEILLPPEVITETQAREQYASGHADALTDLVKDLVGDDLREGLTISLGSKQQCGVSIRIVDENVEIDLTDETITDLLARHLLPRFRAIMRKP